MTLGKLNWGINFMKFKRSRKIHRRKRTMIMQTKALRKINLLIRKNGCVKRENSLQ